MPALTFDLLPGLSRKIHDSLRANGFFSLHDIAAATPDDLRRVKGIKTTAESIHAHACAYVAGEPVWLAPMPRQVIDAPCAYLDIETNPMTGSVWSITVRAEDTVPFSILVCADLNPLIAPDDAQVVVVDSQEEAWALAHDSTPAGTPILHWTGFDAGVMRQTADPSTRELLDPRMTDLHALIKASVAFPLHSRSLKVVAPYLGFGWKTYADWALALMDFQRWVLTGDARSFRQMLSYIRDDVDAMHVVLTWLRVNRTDG